VDVIATGPLIVVDPDEVMIDATAERQTANRKPQTANGKLHSPCDPAKDRIEKSPPIGMLPNGEALGALQMAWLSRLFGIGRSRLFLEGDHEFGFEVVGESKYQDALSNICGGHCEEGHEHECLAELVPEPDNPYDPNAVAVLIEGEKVAYLSRFDAKRYLDELARLGHAGDRASCDAMINGGWDRGGREKGYFGVELDLAWPFRLGARKS
jgi:hypothetical protein